MRHQEELHYLSRPILAHFFAPRNGWKVRSWSRRCGSTAPHKLSGVTSLKGHVLLETPPSQKHLPRHSSPAVCLQEIIQPPDVSPSKLEVKPYGKITLFIDLHSCLCQTRRLELAFHHLAGHSAPGVGFEASPWVQEAGINFSWSSFCPMVALLKD